MEVFKTKWKISVIKRVFYSRVLMELNVSRQADQTAVYSGLGEQRANANSNVLECLESC
jgi:hypothetical protein